MNGLVTVFQDHAKAWGKLFSVIREKWQTDEDESALNWPELFTQSEVLRDETKDTIDIVKGTQQALKMRKTKEKYVRAENKE